MLDDRTTQKLDRKIGGRPPSVQTAQPPIGKATLFFPRHMAGYDVDELDARAKAAVEPAYSWRGRR